MDSAGTLELIRHTGVIAIVRDAGSQAIVELMQALYDGGIRAMEIALNASFGLGLSLSPSVISLCNRYGVLAVPGVFTPTEAVKAWESGARAVKIFPAGVVGPGYVRDLRGPLPQIDMIPVGGVNIGNTCALIKAGACAVGVGAGLVDRVAIASGNYAELTGRAAKLLAEVKKARAQE